MSEASLTIFHLDSERGFRGGQRQMLYLADYLRERGHANMIVCREGEALDLEAKRLRFERLHLPFLTEWDPVSAWQLRKQVLQIPGALMHAHTSHTAALSFMAAEGANLPRVVHRRVDAGVPKGLDYVLKYKRAQRVIAVSEAIRAHFLEAGMPPGQVVTIHDAHPYALVRKNPRVPEETKRYRAVLAKKLEVPVDAVWLGHLAALTAEKDQSTLLKAMKLVLKQVPKAYLLIGGEGPLADALMAEARELSIDGSVRFLGYVTDTASFLVTLDLFVLSSVGEGFGSVLLEAMGHGLPIVATTAGGIPEAVAHEESGLLVPPKSPEALARAMLRILGEPELAKGLGDQGLERVRDFSIESMGGQIEAVYKEVAAQCPA